ncbi:MAG: hypothetical protein LBB83_01455 [Treponema sp.]|nr:hypothetical protein [Treponema sp.]
MARDEGFSDKPAERYYYRCPRCRLKYALTRRYCDCHTRLDTTEVQVTADSEAVIAGALNVEYGDATCHDCGAGCAYCYSFSVLKTNGRGFGGKDCVCRQDSIRCTCCRLLMDGGSAKDVIAKVKRLMSRQDAG